MAGVRKGYVQSPEHVARRMESKRLTTALKPKPFSKDWLEENYIRNGLDCVQIGHIADRDPKTIWSWLSYYGIPTRPRGHDTSHLPKTGRVPGFHLTEEHKQALRAAREKDGRKPYLLADGTHAMKGRTGEKHHSWRGGLTPERQAFYASVEWAAAL